MISCLEAARLSSEALDRPLRFWEQVELRMHLCICRSCLRYDRSLKLLRRILRDETGPALGRFLAPPQRLSDEARERIKKALTR
jgi:hypothetical protein